MLPATSYVGLRKPDSACADSAANTVLLGFTLLISLVFLNQLLGSLSRLVVYVRRASQQGNEKYVYYFPFPSYHTIHISCSQYYKNWNSKTRRNKYYRLTLRVNESAVESISFSYDMINQEEVKAWHLARQRLTKVCTEMKSM